MTDAPHGFRPTSSGLLVPEPLSRERKVIPWDDWRAIERATKLLTTLGIVWQWKCAASTCGKAPIERRREADGGISFRCEHADRVVVKTY